MERFAIGSFAWPILAAAAASALCACGDAHTFKLRTDSWDERQPLDNWNGTIVELHHETLPCNGGPPECLRSVVGDQIEFEELDVVALKSDCSRGAEAAVAIDVQPRSVIFDFSNIESRGAFQKTGFDGYVVGDFVGAAPRIVGARVDREASTLDLDDRRIEIDGRKLRANFAGLALDSTHLVKVDLVFAE